MIKLFKLNKWKESVEQFEKKVSAWIGSVGDVALLQAFEGVYDNDVHLVFRYGEKKSIEQELCLIGWTDLDTLESAVNNAISNVESSGHSFRYLNFVTTSKSARALAVFIVEAKELSNDQPVRDTVPAEEKQNPVSNAEPKPGAKKAPVKRNRKTNGA